MWDTILSEVAKFSYMVSNVLHLDSPLRAIILVLDILSVMFIFYYMYKLIKQTRAEQIVKGILILLILLGLATLFDMVILKFILANLMTYGMLLFIVIFQPELRSAFEKIGRTSKLSDVFDLDNNLNMMHITNELCKAIEIMSLKKIGALIVVQRKTKISEIIKDGVNLSAKISSELLQNIFTPRTPLHDGAVILDKDQMLAAKCILPLASENAVDKRLGTRHRAAVGITEISDALCIVISEETGIISIAEEGKLKRNIKMEELKEVLMTRYASAVKKKKGK